MEVGDILYCHTDGFMNNSNRQFSIEGNSYEVISVDVRGWFEVVDDTGKKHSFTNIIATKWFTYKEAVVPTKTVPKFSFIN